MPLGPFDVDMYGRPLRPPTREEQLARLAEDLARKVQDQDRAIKQLQSPPYMRGTIASRPVHGPNGVPVVSVAVMGQTLEMQVPDKIDMLEIGTIVRLNTKNMSIVEVVKGEISSPSGMIMTVTGSGENGIEIDYNGMTRIVNSQVPVAKGDRVVVNDGGSLILRNLGKRAETFQVESEVNVPWDAIGGLRNAKEEMREAIEGPVKHAAIFRAYGKKAVKGILLYGPPGCGKTLLAKAAATSLAQLYGKKITSGFIYVKGPEVLSKWVGQTEETIRTLFARARDHHKREGYPAVLFIDEADAILGQRGQHTTSGMEKTVVPMFLAEMDGFDEHGPLVLLATNKSEQLDPAVIRDGRVDRKIEVTRPNYEDAMEIFSMYLKDKPLTGNSLIEFAQEFTKKTFCSNTLQKRVCGALIAGVVDQAVSVAMRRDIATGSTTPGLVLEDIVQAVTAVEAQNKNVST